MKGAAAGILQWLHFHCGLFKKEWLGKVTQKQSEIY